MMKKLWSLLFAAVLMIVLGVACDKDKDKNPEIHDAMGVVVGTYSNGFGSLLLQVDEDYSIGATLEYVDHGSCATLPETGTYLNLIQVQPDLDIAYAEIANKKVAFSYRAFRQEKDGGLFVVGNGIANGLCSPPDVPIYVITDYQILND